MNNSGAHPYQPNLTSTDIIHNMRSQTERLIQNGDLDLATECIEYFEPKTLAERRLKEHLRGLVYEYSGNLERAYSSYLLALEKYGENVNLIRDLASACYQLDLVTKWRFYHQMLRRSLADLGDALSVESRISCTLQVGKYMEEDGDLSGGLAVYEECFEFVKSVRNQEDRRLLYLRTLPQIVRLKSHFNHTEKMGFYYSELISINRSDCPKPLDTEVQHSLMLAEIYLVGINHAWARAQTLLEDNSLLESDRRLIYFDFLEEMLIRGECITESMRSYQQLCLHANSFEAEISVLAFNPESARDLAELSGLACVLSWSCYLRILILYFGRTQDGILIDELRNKINLILSSLPSSEAKGFWLNRMKPYLGAGDLIINFSREARTVIFQNKEVDLSRKKGMLILLDAMTDESEKSVDEMIRLLWNCDYSPENYHRLRMTVHRLNQVLYDLTAIPKVFEISADRITVKPSVILEFLVN
ncbi:MAG: hypothetical protein IPJ71_03005 [Bdellovibrionales bacterium]|nr:hypothetical protein [Bdellovibrionales bacterium]